MTSRLGLLAEIEIASVVFLRSLKVTAARSGFLKTSILVHVVNSNPERALSAVLEIDTRSAVTMPFAKSRLFRAGKSAQRMSPATSISELNFNSERRVNLLRVKLPLIVTSPSKEIWVNLAALLHVRSPFRCAIPVSARVPEALSAIMMSPL